MVQAQSENLGSLIDDFDRQQPQGGKGGDEGGSGGFPPKNVILAVVILGCLIGVAVIAARSLQGEVGSLERWTQEVTLIDVETGEVFEDYRLAEDVGFPVRNPNTDTETLMPAEACHWTSDGEAKWDPTWVYVPAGGSATCPDCGRQVVGHNPAPPDDLMLEALDREEAGG